MNVKEFYEKIEANGDAVLGRFMGKEALVIRFLKKFPEDDNFSAAKEAMKKADYGTVLTAVHSLKGISGNLGLDRIYQESDEIVKDIREGREGEITPVFEKLEKDYEKTVELIRQL